MSLLRRRMMMAKQGISGDAENLSDYFHVISHEDQTIAFLFDCQYNFDDGSGWHDLTMDTEIDLPNGSQLYVSALARPGEPQQLEYANNISLAGNIMSLVYGHDFRGKYSLEGYDNVFVGFANSEIDPRAIKNVENLILPATELSIGCYSAMFYVCENITKAPELPATILTDYCYQWMFYGCTKLNHIKMLATDISATGCLGNWVSGVSPTGTFVKSKDATWDVRGENGIPEGWTVKTDDEESGGNSLFPATLIPTREENLPNYNIAKYFLDNYPDMVVDISGSYTPITEDVTIEGSNHCDGKVVGVAKWVDGNSLLFYTENSIANMYALKLYLNVLKGCAFEYFTD